MIHKPPLLLFGHEVVIKAFVGNDAYGQKVMSYLDGVDPSVIISSSGTGDVTIKARFEPNIVTDRMQDKQEKRFIAKLFTLGTDIPTQSTVYYENNKYIVSECIKHQDLTGISYLEVLLT